jgi:hypothetical protein
MGGAAVRWVGPKRKKRWPSGLEEGFERELELEDGERVTVGIEPRGFGWSVHAGNSGTIAAEEEAAWEAARRLCGAIERERRKRREQLTKRKGQGGGGVR